MNSTWHDIHRAKQRALTNPPTKTSHALTLIGIVILVGMIIYINK